MAFDFVSLVAAGDDPMAQVVISKTEPNSTHQEETVGNIKKEDLASEVVEYIDALEAEVTDLSKSLVDAHVTITNFENDNEDIAKSVDGLSYEAILAKAEPSVRALIEKQAADIKKAEDIAKVERDTRLTKEYISKAEALPNIVVEDSDKGGLAGLLRRAAEALTPEDTASLEKALATANTQITKGDLFSEFGRGGAQTTISKSVDAIAEEIRKREPSLTMEQAQAKAYTENPDLFAEAMTNKEA